MNTWYSGGLHSNRACNSRDPELTILSVSEKGFTMSVCCGLCPFGGFDFYYVQIIYLQISVELDQHVVYEMK